MNVDATYGFCVNTPDRGVEPREAKRSLDGLGEAGPGVRLARTLEGPGVREDRDWGVLSGVTGASLGAAWGAGRRTGVVARAARLPAWLARGVDAVVLRGVDARV